MKISSSLAHLSDIFLLPFSVTVIIPLWIYQGKIDYIPDHIIIKVSGVLLLIFGLCMLSYTIFLFGKIGKGTLAPWTQIDKLVVAGPYQYCRNPMISGVLFVLSGESLIFHSTSILIWTGIFFVFNTFYFIIIEEPYLTKKFGAEYIEYKKNTPRWIPKLRLFKKIYL